MKNTWRTIMLAATLAPLAVRLYQWYSDIPSRESHPDAAHKKSLPA